MRKSDVTVSGVYEAIQLFCNHPTVDISSASAREGVVFGGPMGSVAVYVAHENGCNAPGQDLPQLMCLQYFYQICASGDAMGYSNENVGFAPGQCYMPVIKET
jgi:hypothetical protein